MLKVESGKWGIDLGAKFKRAPKYSVNKMDIVLMQYFGKLMQKFMNKILKY